MLLNFVVKSWMIQRWSCGYRLRSTLQHHQPQTDTAPFSSVLHPSTALPSFSITIESKICTWMLCVHLTPTSRREQLLLLFFPTKNHRHDTYQCSAHPSIRNNDSNRNIFIRSLFLFLFCIVWPLYKVSSQSCHFVLGFLWVGSSSRPPPFSPSSTLPFSLSAAVHGVPHGCMFQLHQVLKHRVTEHTARMLGLITR